MAKQTDPIRVEGAEIRFYTEQEEDIISLTDIARHFNERTDQVILNWLRTRSTIDFLGAWEALHNPHFNPLNFEGIRNQTRNAVADACAGAERVGKRRGFDPGEVG